ncbi:MAG TPA: DNA gyrase subunit B [Myxococcales bacterium]|nr:DNA gyrase subunit B [Myxococcales bacterium]
MVSPADYSASDIKVLEGLEAVRKRPGMYIGSTGSRGLHHLVYEIVDNCIDEALAGHCETIDIRLDTDNIVSIKDDGRGIPVDIHKDLQIPAATVVFTKLHAGAKFDNSTYKVSGGLHGVGASVVNALSEWLEVEIWRGGHTWLQRFERGTPVGPMEDKGKTRRRGTHVRFKPDFEIFNVINFNYSTIADRMRELAFLNAGLNINIMDARPAERITESYCFEGGIQAFVGYINENRSVIHEPVFFRDEADGIEVELCFQYHNEYAESLNSFVNCICTIEGGMHETGFRSAHTRAMNEYARKQGLWKKKDSLSGDDLREGLTAVLNVRMTDVQFEGQTKTKLGNPEARTAVEQVVAKHLSFFLEENPDIAKNVLDKACRANTARAAARKARSAVRQGQKTSGRTSLDGKLTRCSSRNPMDRELFIVEGDSAGGSAKQARDRKVQAILPLRGKPLNTERASLAKVLANKEIMAMVQALGAGVGSEFKLEDCQYGRIIILADADDDGAHIRCLLLTFFYRFMRELVTSGRVYVAQPPLYRITTGIKKQSSRYAWDDAELKSILELKSVKGKATVQRFKGLGEMAAIQLWDTTMNPETRTLLRVEVEDAATAEHYVSVLMGDGAEARRNWIIEHVSFGLEDNAMDTAGKDNVIDVISNEEMPQ